MQIQDVNPWWKTSRVEEEYELAVKRNLLDKILKFVDARQILSFVGLRRTGKTTLMHQIIKHLIKINMGSENILYYNFDAGLIEIDDLIKKYESIMEFKIRDRKKIFIFFDEIQKLPDWHNKLKLYYDLNKNIKFFISGSASLFIEKKTKESLAGRTFTFKINLLSFKEFLDFKNIKIENRKLKLWEEELQKYLMEYLKTGGFPELVNEQNNEKIKMYIKESVIDRLIYMDIPVIFKIEEPELLIRIFNIIASNPGMIVDYNNLANDLDRNRKTIASYLFYLEKAFLITKLYNFSSNLLTSEKKNKKFYPASTAFSFFDVEVSKVIEMAVAIALDSKFFYRKQGKEVDFIKEIDTKNLTAIEVKYKQKLTKEDIIGLKSFYNLFNERFDINLIIITKDLDKKDKKIKYIPLWKWLLEN